MENKELICNNIKNIYKNICLKDIFIQAKEDPLNPDIEDAVYIELTTENVYDILDDNIISNIGENKNAIILPSNECFFAYMLYFLYNFNKIVCIENIFEFYQLSKDFSGKIELLEKNTKIEIYNKKILKSKLNNKDLIILNYNNTNKYYCNMLENKIIDEALEDTIIIKVLTPFKQNNSLKLLKIRKINNNNNKVLIFYYKKC